jgi:hypothetical protein
MRISFFSGYTYILNVFIRIVERNSIDLLPPVANASVIFIFYLYNIFCFCLLNLSTFLSMSFALAS